MVFLIMRGPMVANTPSKRKKNGRSAGGCFWFVVVSSTQLINCSSERVWKRGSESV